MKRMGLPDEVASTFLFLSSDLSSYINGENLMVDGVGQQYDKTKNIVLIGAGEIGRHLQAISKLKNVSIDVVEPNEISIQILKSSYLKLIIQIN